MAFLQHIFIGRVEHQLVQCEMDELEPMSAYVYMYVYLFKCISLDVDYDDDDDDDVDDTGGRGSGEARTNYAARKTTKNSQSIQAHPASNGNPNCLKLLCRDA